VTKTAKPSIMDLISLFVWVEFRYKLSNGILVCRKVIMDKKTKKSLHTEPQLPNPRNIYVSALRSSYNYVGFNDIHDHHRFEILGKSQHTLMISGTGKTDKQGKFTYELTYKRLDENNREYDMLLDVQNCSNFIACSGEAVVKGDEIDFEATATLDKPTWSGETVIVGKHINFVATAISGNPVVLTCQVGTTKSYKCNNLRDLFSSERLKNTNHFYDITITVMSWMLNSNPAPNITFNWICIAPGAGLYRLV
jgi:hypothetical protein